MYRKSIASLFLLAVALPAFHAVAGEYTRIARLSSIEGSVSFQQPGETDWVAASINTALQPGDRIYAGERGRAEIEFDEGSVLRLAEKTDIEILSLREGVIQIRILVGLCSLTVHSGVDFELNTPAAAFTAVKKGVYRLEVAENGQSDGIVRKGELQVAGAGFSRRIESGEWLQIFPGNQREPVLARYQRRDAWDEWTDRRNAEMVAYESRRYLPDHVYYGVRDLDRYGRWVVVDAYGPAWVPYYVDAGWSPYWVGRWHYRPAWGWTWTSYEPWGWLPYHYGRWHFSVGTGWCWLPGVSFGFHFWSPGLVRFYRGPSWVSWVPLGPGDYYNVNFYHYRSTHNHYLGDIRRYQRRGPDDLANRHVAGAFRTVENHRFVAGRVDGRGRGSQPNNVARPWESGRMVTDSLGIQPTSMSYAPAPDRLGSSPSHRAGSLPAVVRTEPSIGNAGASRFVRISGDAAPSGRTGAETRGIPGRLPGETRDAGGGNPQALTPGAFGTRSAPQPDPSASPRRSVPTESGDPGVLRGRDYGSRPSPSRSDETGAYGRSVPGGWLPADPPTSRPHVEPVRPPTATPAERPQYRPPAYERPAPPSSEPRGRPSSQSSPFWGGPGSSGDRGNVYRPPEQSPPGRFFGRSIESPAPRQSAPGRMEAPRAWDRAPSRPSGSMAPAMPGRSGPAGIDRPAPSPPSGGGARGPMRGRDRP